MSRPISKLAVIAATMAFAAAHATNAAPACPAPPTLKTGWYIGGQSGYDSFRNHNTIDTPATSALVSHPRLGAYG